MSRWRVPAPFAEFRKLKFRVGLIVRRAHMIRRRTPFAASRNAAPRLTARHRSAAPIGFARRRLRAKTPADRRRPPHLERSPRRQYCAADRGDERAHAARSRNDQMLLLYYLIRGYRCRGSTGSTASVNISGGGGNHDAISQSQIDIRSAEKAEAKRADHVQDGIGFRSHMRPRRQHGHRIKYAAKISERPPARRWETRKSDRNSWRTAR